ncbi:hypothetical protein E2C01_047308 [Portunus trituberculatus]|uniref:Uncharacterized protein n=1 Tax=Portunus trituberculatus TaxID=210409 RepID=A0A5B7G8G9_PORTR|nr:hypothetical protein [Portunus trituberculatus]
MQRLSVVRLTGNEGRVGDERGRESLGGGGKMQRGRKSQSAQNGTEKKLEYEERAEERAGVGRKFIHDGAAASDLCPGNGRNTALSPTFYI